ncbi:glycoside hydrolase family 6 protein, partial [Candidatus Parcubacteria bacterium]|nr:glycoside hydrolase family 6 protein [Candidatus Parcubacteria bacterium]
MKYKLVLIVILWLGGVYAFQAVNNLNIFPWSVPAGVTADGPIDVWWPTNGARVSNTQAFKAMIKEKNVSEYQMFWSVDGGQQNSMYDSSTDYPHKEAMVDLNSWTWRGAGPYKVTFKALDQSNNQIGEATMEIFTTEPANGPVQVETPTASPSVSPSASPSVSSSPSPSPSSSPEAKNRITSNVGAALGIGSLKAETVTDTSAKNVSIVFPTNNADVNGLNTFRGRLDGASKDSYKLYWQVDNGTLNPMGDAGDLKEASVDTTNWNWRSNGQYVVSMVAKDNADNVIAKSDVTITVGKQGNPTPTPTVQISDVSRNIQRSSLQQSVSPSPSASPSSSPSPSAAPVITASNSGNPFSGMKLYFNANNDAARTANEWRSSRPGDATQMDKIGQQPEVTWLGNWNSDISGYVTQKVNEAKSQGAMPVFVAYNIPNRDCGQYSAGGMGSANEYHGWIQKIADSIGNNKAAVILEPDALTLTDCLGSRVGERYAMVKDAVQTLKSKSNIAVYLDAGHPGWISADEMANRLRQSGVDMANGFSLNTSNFFTTQSNVSYGEEVSGKIGGLTGQVKHFIIDTGRNGNGPTSDFQWCNPSGRALGSKPTTN